MQTVVSAYTATSAAGVGVSALHDSILHRRSGLERNAFPGCDIDTWVGRVDAVDCSALPDELKHLSSRNNLLAWHGLRQDGLLAALQRVVRRVGAERVGLVMGTSTSSIGRTEEAYRLREPSGQLPESHRQPEVHNLHSLGIFVAAMTGVRGPAITISTACSSSAKVFATASRWIRHGLVDAVLVGGVDSLCLSVLYGFNSLQLVSASQCRPFDVERDGINLGEAAGFAILAREDCADDAEFYFRGYGESSDAWHMSHPHPEGKGAALAIDRALSSAGLSPEAIEYVNLHGTASRANDLAEALALAEHFPPGTKVSSTKGWTGHALGAAGILEAVVTMNAMKYELMPGTLNCAHPDPELCFQILQENVSQPIRRAMTNSFGFGGNNVALIFEQISV